MGGEDGGGDRDRPKGAKIADVGTEAFVNSVRVGIREYELVVSGLMISMRGPWVCQCTSTFPKDCR
jgi:hypothetical protein